MTHVTKQTSNHRFHSSSPTAGTFLFYATGTEAGVYVGHLDGSVSERLVEAAAAAYSPSGHLLFVRQGTLFAQTFDPLRLVLAGSPTPVAENIVSGTAGNAALSVSTAGPIVYRTGTGAQRHLVWFDRGGKKLSEVAGSERSAGVTLSLSPDERRVALDGGGDIWLATLERGLSSRFTFDKATDVFPIWSPDGERLAFSSNRSDVALDLYAKSASGAGTRLCSSEAMGASAHLTGHPMDGSYSTNLRARLALPHWEALMTFGRCRSVQIKNRFPLSRRRFSSQWAVLPKRSVGRVSVE